MAELSSRVTSGKLLGDRPYAVAREELVQLREAMLRKRLMETLEAVSKVYVDRPGHPGDPRGQAVLAVYRSLWNVKDWLDALPDLGTDWAAERPTHTQVLDGLRLFDEAREAVQRVWR